MSIPVLDDFGNKTTSTDFNIQNMTLGEAKRELSKFELLLMLCGVASFLATAMSVGKFYAGGSLDPATWTGEQTASIALSLMIVATVVAGEIKAFSSGYKGWITVTVTVIFIAFGIFTEVTQAMEREEEGVSIRSESSPTYQAALRSISSISAQAQQPLLNPFASRIADQAGIVARCEAKLAKKQVKHCDGDNATLAALKGQAERTMRASTQSATSALTATLNTAKQWERDEEQHYGMIKLLKSSFGIKAIEATFLFTLFIIVVFRVAFLWIGSEVATYKQVVSRLSDDKGERTDTANTDYSSAKQNGHEALNAKKKIDDATRAPEQKETTEEVPLPEIVRLASLNILCAIADGELKSFSVRAVCDSLKNYGYGKTNGQREQVIYPALLDHFSKEKYVRFNDGDGDPSKAWIEPKEGEPSKNGTRQKWLINLAYCQEKAEFIPRG